MPRRCCVPGCKSNYDSTIKTTGLITTFGFPKDEERRNAWLHAIPRKEWTPSSFSVVCINHFHPEDVVSYADWKKPDGTMAKLLLKCPKLSKEALPSIFHNIPSFLNIRKPSEWTDRNARREATMKHNEERVRQFLQEDTVDGFNTFYNMDKTPIKCEPDIEAIVESVPLTFIAQENKVKSTKLINTDHNRTDEKIVMEENQLPLFEFVCTGEQLLVDTSVQCKTCNKTFIDKSNFKAHQCVHNDEHPFVCDVCNKTFSHKAALKKHLVVHTDERPFVCSICNKSCSFKGDLKRHLLIHTGEHTFMCNICNKTFNRKMCFERHVFLHSRKRSYVCYM